MHCVYERCVGLCLGDLPWSLARLKPRVVGLQIRQVWKNFEALRLSSSALPTGAYRPFLHNGAQCRTT